MALFVFVQLIKKGAIGSLFYLSSNYLLTASFNALPAEKAGALRAAIFNSAPVRGLRPVRAARLDTLNVPKPIKVTVLLFLSAAVIASVAASHARPAAAFERSALAAIALINSDLFMFIISLGLMIKTSSNTLLFNLL